MCILISLLYEYFYLWNKLRKNISIEYFSRIVKIVWYLCHLSPISYAILKFGIKYGYMLSRVNCFIHFTFFNTIPVYIITRRYSTSFMNCVFDQQNFFLWIQWDHNLTISIKFNLKYQILNNDYTWHHQNKIILSNIVVDTDLSIFHIFSLSQIFKWCHFLISFCTSTSTSGRWLSDWVLVFLCPETWTGFKLQDTWALFNLISSLESGHFAFVSLH